LSTVDIETCLACVIADPQGAVWHRHVLDRCVGRRDPDRVPGADTATSQPTTILTTKTRPRRERRDDRPACDGREVGVEYAFGPTVALDRFDLSIAAGEVVALMGANGAGKSTIVKILSGGLSRRWRFARTARQAVRAGLTAGSEGAGRSDNASVDRRYRRAHPCRLRTTSCSIVLNNAATPWFVTPAARLEEARSIAALVGLDIDLRAPLFTLPLATRQLVTLARALASSQPFSYLMNRRQASRLPRRASLYRTRYVARARVSRCCWSRTG